MKLLLYLILVPLVFFGCNKSGNDSSAPPDGNPPTDGDDDDDDDGGDTDIVLEPEMPFSETPVPALSGNVVFIVAYQTFLAAEANSINLQTHEVSVTCGPTDRKNKFIVSPDSTKFLRINDKGNSEVTDLACNYRGSCPSYPDAEDHYAWTPDSNYVYYGKYYQGIYEIDMLKKSGRLIIASSMTYDHNVCISTDGKYLVWTHHEYGYDCWILCMSRTGNPSKFGAIKTLWSGRTTFDQEILSYFADEKNLVIPEIISDDAHSSKTGLLNVETLKITYAYLNSNRHTKSPDGKFEAYTSYFNSKQTGIDILALGEKEPVRLDNISSTLWDVELLTFSPDSQYLVIGRYRSETGYNEFLLYSMDFQNKWFLAETATGELITLNWIK